MNETAELAWKMLCELRIELRETQKIRSQAVGFKVTFVTASFGFIFGMKKPDLTLLFVPAFAAVAFDSLIISYSYSIKRIGYYTRHYLEPKLRVGVDWPVNHPFWEEVLTAQGMGQHFSKTANLAMTTIAITAAAGFIKDISYEPHLGSLFALLIALYFLDIYFTFYYKYTPNKELEWPQKGEEEGRRSG